MALPLLPLLLLGGAAIALTSRKAKAAPATYRERCDAMGSIDLIGREICKLESTWYKDTKPKLDSSLGDVWLLKNTQDTVAVLVESDSSESEFIGTGTPYSLRNIYAYLQWMRGQEGLPFPDTLVYVSLSRGYDPVYAQEQLGIAKMTADMKPAAYIIVYGNEGRFNRSSDAPFIGRTTIDWLRKNRRLVEVEPQEPGRTSRSSELFKWEGDPLTGMWIRKPSLAP